MGLGCPRWPHRSWRVSPRGISLCSKVSTPQTVGTTSDRRNDVGPSADRHCEEVPRQSPLDGTNKQAKISSWLPSGKLTVCYGKSPLLMGKSTMSMAIFNSYGTAITRGYPMNDPNDITINCSVTPCWATAAWSLDSSASHLPSPATLQRSLGKIWTCWEGLGRIISILKGLYWYCYS
jgi:hypothetical protein